MVTLFKTAQSYSVTVLNGLIMKVRRKESAIRWNANEMRRI